MNDLFKSKRFWVAVASVATVLLREQLNLDLTEDQVQQLVLIIGSWIVGDSLRATVPPAASVRSYE